MTEFCQVRRAQSVPDYEVLVGTPAARWKLIGNGVDRKVALVLGLSLREAWLRSRPGIEDLNITDGYTDDRAAVYFAKTANPPTKINISVPVKDDYGEDSEDELASTLDIPNIFSSRSITKSTSSTTESTGGDEIVKGHKRHRIEMPGHMSMKRSKHQKHHID